MLKTAWDWTKSLGVALILALMIKTSVVEAYKIPSSSMEETLLVGDFLLANKFIYGMRLPIPFVDIKLPALADPKPGDIIIFKYPKDPSQNYIKRCVAVEGQKLRIIDKQLFIDGKPVPLPEHAKFEDYRLIPGRDNGTWGRNFRDNMATIEVPEGMLFMMGDNRDNSSDSRFWGFLDRKLVLGEAMIIHWSWAPDDNAPRISSTDPLSYIKSIAYNIYHLPDRVRWGRLASIIR
ncbi:MAG: signal peptidase I [candidate division Zixibacteria bacterium]